MKAVNLAVILELLISLTTRVQDLAKLLRTAQAEGRDITAEELDALVADDDIARAALEAAILRASER